VNKKVPLSILLSGFIIISINNNKLNSIIGRWQILETNVFFLFAENNISELNYPANINHFQIQLNKKKKSVAKHANTHTYVLNDWLQITVERGIMGFVVIFICFFYLCRSIKKNICSCDLSNIQLIISLLISFSVYVLFSYPLQIKSLLAMYIFLFLFLLLYDFKNLFTVGIYIIKEVKFNKKQLLIKDLISSGYSTKAYNEAKDLQNECPNLYIPNLFLAQSLLQINKTNACIKLLEDKHKTICSYEFHILLGNIYQELGNIEKTKANYYDACYLVPHKLEPKYLLMQLYDREKNRDSAIYFANKICLQLPKSSIVKYKLNVMQAENVLEKY
jgi:hypothetical protein